MSPCASTTGCAAWSSSARPSQGFDTTLTGLRRGAARPRARGPESPDPLGLLRADREARQVAGVLSRRQQREQVVRDTLEGRGAAERDGRERPSQSPAPREPGADDLLDVLCRCHLVPNEPQSLAQERELETVPGEAGYVEDAHRPLPECAQERLDSIDSIRCGVRARDELNERHQERRVPVVRSQRPFGGGDRTAQVADAKGGRIRRKRGVCEACGERPEDVSLEGEILGQ